MRKHTTLTNGAIAFTKGIFAEIRLPDTDDDDITLVEIPLDDGARAPRSMRVSVEKASAAIDDGELVILGPPNAMVAPGTTTSPDGVSSADADENAGPRRLPPRRVRNSIAGLRARGLIMTGEEYARLLERRKRKDQARRDRRA